MSAVGQIVVIIAFRELRQRLCVVGVRVLIVADTAVRMRSEGGVFVVRTCVELPDTTKVNN